MAGKNISMAVIRRLPKYYRYLGDLLDNDVQRISSKELSEIIGFTASQIRQDLNNFGGFGQQGYGYNIEALHAEIGKILGLDRPYNAILIGAGNLGQAIANYSGFRKAGFEIKGLDTFKDKDGYYVFHAGTKFDDDGKIVTNGGRVLGVTAKGKDLKEARANAYKATEWIDFDNKYMRHDIGKAIDEA